MFIKSVGLILISLFTLKFILSLLVEDKKQNKFIQLSFCTFISSFYLVFLSIKLSEKIESMHLPTIIPLYLSIHITMLLTMSIISFYSIFLINLVFKQFTDVFISDFFLSTIVIIKDLFKKIHFFYKLCLKFYNFIDTFFNPFSYIKSISEINNYKIIKLFFLLSYLFSGIILLSPITNYFDKYLVAEYTNFIRDYELYKTVFVTSLIPFTLTYISKIKFKYID